MTDPSRKPTRATGGHARQSGRGRFRYPRSRRVRDSREFGTIIKRGRYAADATLVVNATVARVADATGRFPGRIGITIPSKVGTAVERNRWKRLIREAYRLEQEALPIGFDLIVRPRRGAVADFAAIRRSLRSLARRATGAPGGRTPRRRDG